MGAMQAFKRDFRVWVERTRSRSGKDFDEVSIFRLRCTSVLLRTHAGRSTYHPVKPWGKLPILLDGHHSLDRHLCTRRIPFWDG